MFCVAGGLYLTTHRLQQGRRALASRGPSHVPAQVPPRQPPLVRLVYRPEPPSTPPSRFPCAPQCAPAPPAFSLACACSPASPHRDRPCDRLRCLGLAHMPPFSSHISPPPPPPSPPSLPPPLPPPSPLPPSMTRTFFTTYSKGIRLARVSCVCLGLRVVCECTGAVACSRVLIGRC